MKYIWSSLRPNQWIKNLFIFAGILFSQNFFNRTYLFSVIIAFIIFCFLSGAVYILNDLIDCKFDKAHPDKSTRAIASGKISHKNAIFAFVLISLFSLFGAFYLNTSFLVVAFIYFSLQVLYSCILKHIAILDVFAIAFGFVLRVIAGAVVINVEISSWLFVCTTLLSLFLGFGKRRSELVILEGSAKNHRKSLAEYSPYLLDQMISIVTAGTVIAYILYTISEETVSKFGTKNLIFTVPFVLYGIFRYLYLIHHKGAGENPGSSLVADKPLIINIFLWAILSGIILYV